MWGLRCNLVEGYYQVMNGGTKMVRYFEEDHSINSSSHMPCIDGSIICMKEC